MAALANSTAVNSTLKPNISSTSGKKRISTNQDPIPPASSSSSDGYKYGTLRSTKSNRNSSLNRNPFNNSSLRTSSPTSEDESSASASPSDRRGSSSSFDSTSSLTSISKRRRTSRDTDYLDINDERDRDRPTSWTSMADTTCEDLHQTSSNPSKPAFNSSISRPNSTTDIIQTDSNQDREQEEDDDASSIQSSSSSFDRRIDSLLSATMIALESSNSLLLSTLAGRSDLARFRALDHSLGVIMDHKELELKYQLDRANEMSNWVDKASKKLDGLIELERKNERQQTVTAVPGWGLGFGSRIMGAGTTPEASGSHWRKPSIGNISSASSGISSLKGKDEDATIGKTAAKRLEKMLKNSQDALEKEREREQQLANESQDESNLSSSIQSQTNSTGSNHSRKPSLAARDALGAIVARDRDAPRHKIPTPTSPNTSIASLPTSETSETPPPSKDFSFPTSPGDKSSSPSNQTIVVPNTPPSSRPVVGRKVCGGGQLLGSGSRIRLGQSTPATPSTSVDNSSNSPLADLMERHGDVSSSHSRKGSNASQSGLGLQFSGDSHFTSRPPLSPSANGSNSPSHRRPDSRASLASIEESNGEPNQNVRQTQDFFKDRTSSRHTSVSSLASVGGLSVRSSSSYRPRSPLIPWGDDGWDVGGSSSVTQESIVEKNLKGNLASALGFSEAQESSSASERLSELQSRSKPKPSPSISTSISNSTISSNASVKSASTISPATAFLASKNRKISNSNLAPPSITSPFNSDDLSISPSTKLSSSFLDSQQTSPSLTQNGHRRSSREYNFGHSKSPSLLNGPTSPSASLSSFANQSPFHDLENQNLDSKAKGNGEGTLGRNGALAALKRLNEQDKPENEAQGSNLVPTSPGNTSAGGWGFASWIGFGGGDTSKEIEREEVEPQHTRKPSNASVNSIGKRPGMMRGEVM